MYFPEFSITTNILKSIGKIEACKALVEATPIIPSWQKLLQREAEIKNAYCSNHFEGNSLTFKEVKAFFDGKPQELNKRSLKEIENYKKALNLAYILEISEETLKAFHKTLLKDIAPEGKLGSYRTTTSQIKNTSITSPAPDEILAQIRSLLYWFEENDSKDLPPPLRSAVMYYEILRIEPFETENKKIAGLVAIANLFKEGYDENKYLSAESYFDESPTAFYSVLRSTQNPTGDITRWVEYYLLCLANEFIRLKDKIINLSKDNKIRQVAGTTPLSERQERMIEFIQDYGSIQNKDFTRLFPLVSEDSILRDLKDLMLKNLIVKIGSTKSARYITRKDINATS